MGNAASHVKVAHLLLAIMVKLDLCSIWRQLVCIVLTLEGFSLGDSQASCSPHPSPRPPNRPSEVLLARSTLVCARQVADRKCCEFTVKQRRHAHLLLM